MTEPRLKTEIWVKAQIRQCDVAFIPAMVVRRGDADAGQVLIKRNRLDGTFEVFARTVAPDGGAGWRRITGPEPVDEAAARSVIDRETGFDPDLWVLEIEDSGGKYELDGPLV
jgi:hypothetical protein